ncbi:hypothetical protein EVAR_5268_1 [Eumeta japonica]|uniref:Uncharacterized protein n=1 Tax=Eumeta variegata TaxID=151549 RepID=A0A4C1SHX8_EUMVA|nr:hypothetical protein EVAR_5268_1 [Eumeta japonica]
MLRQAWISWAKSEIFELLTARETAITVWMSSPNDEVPAVADTEGGTGSARRSASLGDPGAALGGNMRFVLTHGLEGVEAGQRWPVRLLPARSGKLIRSQGGAAGLFLVLGGTARTSQSSEPSLRQSLCTECTGKPWPQRRVQSADTLRKLALLRKKISGGSLDLGGVIGLAPILGADLSVTGCVEAETGFWVADNSTGETFVAAAWAVLSEFVSSSESELALLFSNFGGNWDLLDSWLERLEAGVVETQCSTRIWSRSTDKPLEDRSAQLSVQHYTTAPTYSGNGGRGCPEDEQRPKNTKGYT